MFGQKTCQLTSVSLNGNTGKGGVRGCIEVDYVNPFFLADLGFKGAQGKGFLSTMELQLMFLHGHWTGEIGSSDMIILPNPTPEPVSLLLFTAGSVAHSRVDYGDAERGYVAGFLPQSVRIVQTPEPPPCVAIVVS